MGNILERLFFSTWWVVAIFVITLSLFERSLSEIHADELMLNHQIDALQTEIADAQLIGKRRRDRLYSIEDPAWIELLLIKHLGLIPEGYHKYVLHSGS